MKILITALTLLLIASAYAEAKDSEPKADTSYTFDNVLIEGYMDNPTPFYITNADDGENMIVELDRSFADAIKRNTDKETISRIDN